MNLAIFDLDNTLLADDSDFLWGQFLVEQGMVDADWYASENQRFYDLYKAGNLNIHEFQRFSLQPLIDNPADTMLTLRERFVRQCIEPAIAPGAPALIAEHRAQGDELLIITATNSFVTTPIAALLGIQNLLATDPEVIDGIYTGTIHGTPCFQAGKLVRLNQWQAQQPHDFEKTWGYSDSINDLPLLERVDVPTAVDPDQQLRKIAASRGWQIKTLRG